VKPKGKPNEIPVMSEKQQASAIKKASGKTCALLVCIDERTGMLKILKGDRCPKGYMRKVDSAVQKGIMFNPETLEE
jgi:hypothetical protein